MITPHPFGPEYAKEAIDLVIEFEEFVDSQEAMKDQDADNHIPPSLATLYMHIVQASNFADPLEDEAQIIDRSVVLDLLARFILQKAREGKTYESFLPCKCNEVITQTVDDFIKGL